MAIKSYSAFREPSPYEQESRRAEQQRRLAEMLQQQSMAEEDPYTFQGIRAMPSPAAALAKMLSAYGAKKASEKAEEAKAKAEQSGRSELADYIESFEPAKQTVNMGELAALEMPTPMVQDGRISYAAPSVVNAPNQRMIAPSIDQPITAEVGGPLTAAQKRARALEGLRSGNPLVQQFATAQYEKTLEKPEEEEFYAPTETAHGLVQFGKRGGVRKTEVKAPAKTEAEMTEYQREMLGLRKRDVALREARAATGRGLSPTVQKEIFDTDENILAVETGLDLLDQALKLSPVAYEGVGASQRATAATMLPDALEPGGTKETLEFDLLLKQQVLPQLKSIFGAAPTEGERAILLELQGSSSLPKKTRESVLKRAKDAARRRLDFNKNKAQQLREGSYFTEQPAAALPDGFELE